MMKNKLSLTDRILINAVIYFASNTKYFGKTKMQKLLFFLDYFAFRSWGDVVIDGEWRTYEHGPLDRKLQEIFKIGEIDKSLYGKYFTIKIKPGGSTHYIIPKRKFNPDYFSERELNLMKWIAEKTKDMKASEIEYISHNEKLPWKIISDKYGEGHRIAYIDFINPKTSNCIPEEMAKEAARDLEFLNYISNAGQV